MSKRDLSGRGANSRHYDGREKLPSSIQKFIRATEHEYGLNPRADHEDHVKLDDFADVFIGQLELNMSD
jgi:hypothetical protein